MLTYNIDVLDKLRNGQFGMVFHIKVDINQAVTKIYIKFDDYSADRISKNKNKNYKIIFF